MFDQNTDKTLTFWGDQSKQFLQDGVLLQSSLFSDFVQQRLFFLLKTHCQIDDPRISFPPPPPPPALPDYHNSTFSHPLPSAPSDNQSSIVSPLIIRVQLFSSRPNLPDPPPPILPPDKTKRNKSHAHTILFVFTPCFVGISR